MKSGKGVGILLFLTTTAIIMSAHFPVRRYLRRLPPTEPKSERIFRYSKFSASLTPAEYGKLIVKSSDDLVSNNWQNLVSSVGKLAMDGDSEAVSSNDDLSCELEVVNDFGRVVTICWISSTGKLYHYYPISDGSIKDGSVSNSHVEYTTPGHSFIVYIQKEGASAPKTIKDVDRESILFLYQPKCVRVRHILNIRCINPTLQPEVTLRCESIEDKELVDTTGKEYVDEWIAGFCVKCEPGVFESNESLMETLVLDLEAISSLLSPRVLEALRRDISFWLNNSISYGFKSKPVNAKMCTYHPVDGQEWLKRHGLTVLKAGCIEICSARDYLKDRCYWGLGGLILHELMHCVHDRYADGGYDCELIKSAYNVAMESKKYESVPVHGPQGANGKTVKAYACANCMEFFAELSVAYLWNVDTDTEYNKWFPHNRSQLESFDEKTFRALDEFWRTVDINLIERFANEP